MPEVKRILIPVVFSENDALAADYARQFAASSGAEVDLLHVTRTLDLISEDILQAVHKDFVSYEKETAKKLMDAFVDKALSGVKVRNRAVLQGNPTEEILRYARDNDIQMIVIATHCRKGLESIFVGSVAERVIKRATCPVLAVHPPCPT